MAAPAPDQLAQQYDVQETVDYILQGQYRHVALQFPDEQLADSPRVAQLLQQRLGDRARVFILADTAYNPLGVDEVAAQHLAAQCVIHYGRASLVPANALPAFFVLPKEPLDVATTVSTLQTAIGEASQAKMAEGASRAASTGAAEESSGDGGCGVSAAATSSGYRGVVVLLDQAYQHCRDALEAALVAAGCSGRSSGGGGGGDVPDDVHPKKVPLILARVIARSLTPRAAAGPTPMPAGAGPAAPAVVAPRPAGGCCMQASGASCGPPQQQQQLGRQQSQEAQLGCTQPGCPQVSEQAASCAGPAGCGAGDCTSGGVEAGEPLAPAQSAVAKEESDGTAAVEEAAPPGQGPGQAGLASCTGPGGDARGCSGDADCGEPSTSMAGLRWSLPPGACRSDCLYVWVGPSDSSALRVLQMTHSACDWLSYDPADAAADVARGVSEETRRLLKRRNFLVEKARAANIVGLLVGTLGSAGFLDVISALRRLATAAGKKTYTFLMGKPNPAKLGNFPEVDVFVSVSDAQGLILDCREYLAPLVSPWEAGLAFTGRHIDPHDYRLEMRDVLDLEREVQQQQQQQQQQGAEPCEVSDPNTALATLGAGLSLATRGSGAGSRHEIVARSAAEYLALKRTWKGLEMPATGASPKAAELAVEGRSGRAAVYEDEASTAGAGQASAW